MNNVWVIIFTYNAISWLRACLNSSRNSNVIVLENNYKKAAISFTNLNFPEVKILKQSENLCIGRAIKFGLDCALSQGAQQNYLLNQDAYLENLGAIQIKNSVFGIISPIYLSGKRSRIVENFSKYLECLKNHDFYSDFVPKKPIQNIYEVLFVNAAEFPENLTN